jgi:hypothetical protein
MPPRAQADGGDDCSRCEVLVGILGGQVGLKSTFPSPRTLPLAVHPARNGSTTVDIVPTDAHRSLRCSASSPLVPRPGRPPTNCGRSLFGPFDGDVDHHVNRLPLGQAALQRPHIEHHHDIVGSDDGAVARARCRYRRLPGPTMGPSPEGTIIDARREAVLTNISPCAIPSRNITMSASISSAKPPVLGQRDVVDVRINTVLKKSGLVLSQQVELESKPPCRVDNDLGPVRRPLHEVRGCAGLRGFPDRDAGIPKLVDRLGDASAG